MRVEIKRYETAHKTKPKGFRQWGFELTSAQNKEVVFFRAVYPVARARAIDLAYKLGAEEITVIG